MRRREFLQIAVWGGSAAAALCSLAGCGPLWASSSRQTTRLPRVALLAFSTRPYQEGLWDGLHTYGYNEGHNVVIERRFADGDASRLVQLARELVDTNVDLIVAAGTRAAIAARDATSTIPIVHVSSGDPVANGLVATLGRPGGNSTGTTSLIRELAGKRLELLQQLVPDASRIVVLVDASDSSIAESQWDELQAAAKAARVQLQRSQVFGLADVESALQAVRDRSSEVLMSLLDPLATANPADLVGLVETKGLAAIYPAREFVEVGGLMSYGPDLREQFQRAAFFADKILRGRKPADLPVERPARFELVINRRTAQTLDISMTESTLLQVDEVI
jgi:putative ABC transport system substrate-binding protein